MTLRRYLKRHGSTIGAATHGADADRDDVPLSYCAVFKVIEFEEVRASLGFQAANRVMQTLAERLRAGTAAILVGRVGRTTIEVGCAVPAGDDPSDLLLQARLLLEQPIEVCDLLLSLSVACGAAPLTGGCINGQAFDRAAAALAKAQHSEHRITVSDRASATSAASDLAIVRALQRAIATDELELHYQPKLHCRVDRILSGEALLRWQDAQFGAVPIERVIAIAERMGMIEPLTAWVVARAIEDRATLAAQGHDLTLYVNLSGKLLGDRALIADLIEQCVGQGIGFEITETAVIDDPADAIANVTAMSDAGIRIAIDDYGSGLSSLAYLKQLPAHELKIDRMFVSELVTSHRDPLLVRSSIDLAHALEMEVTAEGVDDVLTLSLLRAMGCDIIQGFLISRALPLDELATLLDDSASFDGFGRSPHALQVRSA